MISLNSRRWRARLCRSGARLGVLAICIILFLDCVHVIAGNRRSARLSQSSISLPTANSHVFIASMHWNNVDIIRSHWIASVLHLVSHLGTKNVYISIVESGSWDGTKIALRELDLELDKLGVERNIELLETTHADEISRKTETQEEGWIWTSRGKKELRRIPHLAGIRNHVMNKLRQLANPTDGREKRIFNKVLWLNDVIFTTEDVTTLMATRDGDYAAVCAQDFSSPPLFYDSFALRDISGAKAISQTWPYFIAAESRNAIISNMPVPVQSCWNGMVVFQADPFYKHPPLRFRGIPDSLARHHLEGSECCLIHADNELSASRGVWLNPNVRVSYNPEASKIVNPENGIWPSKVDRVKGIWSNRWARWTGFAGRYMERWDVKRRTRSWLAEIQQEGTVPSVQGAHCIIKETQVLVEDGWAHV